MVSDRWVKIIIAIIITAVLIWALVPRQWLYIGGGIAAAVIGTVSYLTYKRHGAGPFKAAWNKFVKAIKAKERTGKPARTPIPKAIEEYVFRRAHNRCQYDRGHCGRTENLEIHHIDRDRTNHDRNNLILLCPEHHEKADHGNYRVWQLKDWMKYPGTPKDYGRSHQRHP
jgi:hypothetical protein